MTTRTVPNFYPKYLQVVNDPDGIPRLLTAQIAGYSLTTDLLVVDVGEAQEAGFPVDSIRVTLAQNPCSLKTSEDVLAALDLAVEAGGPYRWVKCSAPGCERERLDSGKSNRLDGRGRPLCEACFLAALDAKYAAARAKEQVKIEKSERELYAKGLRWTVDAWIHPKRGGDDYQVTLYFATQPVPETIEAALARTSRVLTDYSPPRELAG